MTDKNNNKSSYEDTYYLTPRYIRKLEGMTLAFLDVYETMFQFWNKGLTCFLSNKAIAERTGVKDRQIFEALAYFEKCGELKRIQKGLKRYLIRPEKAIQTDCSKFDKDCATAHGSTNINQDCAPAHPPLRSSAVDPCAPAHTEYKEENIKNLITTSDKKEEVINQSSFFSAMQTERVLRIRLETKCLPEFSINEFLKICETHVKTDTPKNLNFNKAQRLAGLCKMIAMGEFEPPVSYTVTKKKQKESVIQNRIAGYNEYAGRIKSDINLKLVPANTKIKNYEEWVNG